MQVYFSWNSSDLDFSLGLGLSLVCGTWGKICVFFPLNYKKSLNCATWTRNCKKTSYETKSCSYFVHSFILLKRAFVLRLTTQMSSIRATILFSLLSAYQILSLGSVLILSNSWLESVGLRWFIFSASVYVAHVVDGTERDENERKEGQPLSTS